MTERTNQFGEATARPAVQVKLEDARREEARFTRQVGVPSARLHLQRNEPLHEVVRNCVHVGIIPYVT